MSETNLCPICGAYSPRSCEMLDEGGGECPWELSRDDEPDPDHLREDRDERRRLDRDWFERSNIDD